MRSRPMLPALLLSAIFPMLACQLLAPVPRDCRVYMPDAGWAQRSHGDKIAFSMDDMEWTATVDCKAGRLVDGEPVRPRSGREISVPVDATTYKLITDEPDTAMEEYRAGGSHVRIGIGEDYYVAVLSAAPAALGQAMIRYFMAGQTDQGVAVIYCYNETKGQAHTSLPVIASMWTASEPAMVRLVCSGRGFILEVSTEVTSQMLEQGPTPVPATPAPTITPEPPGSPCLRPIHC